MLVLDGVLLLVDVAVDAVLEVLEDDALELLREIDTLLPELLEKSAKLNPLLFPLLLFVGSVASTTIPLLAIFFISRWRTVAEDRTLKNLCWLLNIEPLI